MPKLTNDQTGPAEPGEWVSVEEAAARAKVNRSTIYQWITAGRLISRPGESGRGRVVLTSDVASLVAAGPTGPADAWQHLIADHREMLREAFRICETSPMKLTEVGQYVPWALFLYLMQLGRGLQTLLEAGYPEAAKPVARAMIGAAINIVAIVDADSDGRALQYVVHSRAVRRKGLERLVAQGHLTDGKAQVIDQIDTDLEDKKLAGFRAAGIEPAPLGKGKNTWHGLSDKDLFDRMDATRWYQLYYGPLSDAGAHASAGAAGFQLLDLIFQGQGVVGPRDADPTYIVLASLEAVFESLFQLDRHLSLGRTDDITVLHNGAGAAIGAAIRASLGGQAP
jgi:hypothetical protein